MLAHNIRDILSIVPEALDMVKKANLEEDFPLDNPDSASASYLRAHYLQKVAGKRVDTDLLKKIEKAASLYGVKTTLEPMVGKFASMEKAASQHNPFQMDVKAAEAMFEGDLAGFGFLSIEKTAEAAQTLYDTYGSEVTSPAVLRYVGQHYLNKEAAVKSLANRYAVSKDTAFVKMARVIVEQTSDNDFSQINEVCKSVTVLDKKAGLDILGFNFYKEALMSKEAMASSLNVNLAGDSIPYESFAKFGKDRISSSVGKDIADEFTGNPATDKAMLESLPRDIQLVLKSLVKSC